MKLYLYNTREGLKPMYDDDFDKKKKLKLGEVYLSDIKLARNYELHKKYFKLINVAWNLLGEKAHQFFKTENSFRKSIQMAAGHSELVYSITRKEWIEQSLSINYESLSGDEFEDLYERVKDVIWELLEGRGLVTEENFNNYLRDF